jgi:poly(3-hydroxybutyrate) depolymerase
VVAPQGDAGVLGGSWSLGNDRADGRQTDRVSLQSELAFLWSIADCLRSLGIPLSGDVYLAGLSQGGKIATRLACSTHAGFTVKAVAVAAGVQAEPGLRCPSPIPLLLFQGGLDPVVPFCTSGSFLYRPAAASLGVLARSAMNGCSSAPAVPRGASSADMIATRVFEYQGCAAPTVLVWTPLDVHVWPGELWGTRQSGSAVALRFFASQGLDAALPGLKGSDAPWPCGQQWT